MAEPIIFTLDPTTPIVINKKDIVLKLVQFFIFNPGGTSSFYEKSLLSLKRVVKSIGPYKEELRRNIENELNNIFNIYFPNEKVTAEVTISVYEETKLTIGIEIVYPPDGRLVIEQGDIVVNKDGTLTFVFSREDNKL